MARSLTAQALGDNETETKTETEIVNGQRIHPERIHRERMKRISVGADLELLIRFYRKK
jgi:hypothetical protein